MRARDLTAAAATTLALALTPLATGGASAAPATPDLSAAGPTRIGSAWDYRDAAAALARGNLRCMPLASSESSAACCPLRVTPA